MFLQRTGLRLMPVLVASVSLASFAYYARLIGRYPDVYWADAHVRLAHLDDVLLGRWLPALQGLLFAVSHVTSDLDVIRVVLAAVSAAGLIAVYGIGARLLSPLAGIVAVLLLAPNVMFAGLAVVPYAEVMFIGLACGALVLLDDPASPQRYRWGIACLALACLARYEGWLLAAIIFAGEAPAVLRGFRRGAMPRQTLLGMAVVALPCVAWATLGGLELQAGETALRERLTLEHWSSVLREFWDLLEWQVSPLVRWCAVVGVVVALSRRRNPGLDLRVLTFVLACVLMIGLVQPFSPGNLRQTFVPLVFVHVYAAVGLVGAFGLLRYADRWLGRAVRGRLESVLPFALAVVAFLSLWPRADNFVAAASREPLFYGAQVAGRWLREQPLDGAGVYVLTDDPVQPYAVAAAAGLPPERVLSDDGLPDGEIGRRLAQYETIYVLLVAADRRGLTDIELLVASALESGLRGSRQHELGPALAWTASPRSLPLP